MKKKHPPLRAIGINNICYDRTNRKKYSIQYYDMDIKESKMLIAEFNTILQIFPNDLILYQTKHGLHFISFTILDNIFISKANVLKTTKLLNETQDYFPYQKELTLRVSGKYKRKRLSKTHKIISKKPKFLLFFKEPNKCSKISKNHLEFYFKWLNLPKKIYEYYLKYCDLKKYDITMSHYRTGD